MTTSQRRAIVTGLLTLVIGASVVGVGNLARSSVVFQTELDARLAARDVRDAEREERSAASMERIEREVGELSSLMLDILCLPTNRPRDWRCGSGRVGSRAGR